MSSAAICFSTFLGCLLGSFVPLVNTELVVLSAVAIAPVELLLPIVLIAVGTQMLAKSVLYCAGAGFLRLPPGRYASRLQDALTRAQRWQKSGSLFLFTSASTGFPPFYLTSVASGAIRVPFARFFALGFVGRFIRFSALVMVPHLWRSL
ncbi:MAG: VTT domain-containing protein [Gemmatimonadota bacterium]